VEIAVPLFPNAIISENEGCRIKLLKVSTVRIDKRTVVTTIIGECRKQESRDGKRAKLIILNFANF
jgi:hypothetical protein